MFYFTSFLFSFFFSFFFLFLLLHDESGKTDGLIQLNFWGSGNQISKTRDARREERECVSDIMKGTGQEKKSGVRNSENPKGKKLGARTMRKMQERELRIKR